MKGAIKNKKNINTAPGIHIKEILYTQKNYR